MNVYGQLMMESDGKLALTHKLPAVNAKPNMQRYELSVATSARDYLVGFLSSILRKIVKMSDALENLICFHVDFRLLDGQETLYVGSHLSHLYTMTHIYTLGVAMGLAAWSSSHCLQLCRLWW